MIQLAPALAFIYFSLDGVLVQLEKRAELTARTVGKALYKFPPDLWTAANAIIEFGTGLPSVFLTSYYSGIEAFIQEKVKEAGYHNKLLRFDNAISISFQAIRSGISELTLTSDDGILVYLSQALGRMVWTFAKHVKLLRQLIGANTLEEVVELIYNKLKRRAQFLRAIAFYIGVIVFFAFVGFQIFLVGFLVNLINGKTLALLLSQDSMKKRIPVRKTIRKRVNLRTGPDK